MKRHLSRAEGRQQDKNTHERTFCLRFRCLALSVQVFNDSILLGFLSKKWRDRMRKIDSECGAIAKTAIERRLMVVLIELCWRWI